MGCKVNIIPSYHINKAKWDACIQGSPDAVIYACSFYLDHMADNWSGVVLGDYDAVMPVPWRKKMGIRYAYDVPFVQQLGWFAKPGVVNTETLFKQLLRFVKYGSYSFNHCNKISAQNAIRCNNYIIHLSSSYQSIRENYKTDAVNNLKKAERFNLSYQPCNFVTAIEMYRLAYESRFANTTEKDYLNFTALCNASKEKEMVFARMVVDEKTGILLSTALFLRYGHRIYNMMNTTIEEGRAKSANHFLLDNVLKEFAGTDLIFDFEGSDIPGIKLFYEKFGAVNQPYQRLQKFNRLPFPLNMLKR